MGERGLRRPRQPHPPSRACLPPFMAPRLPTRLSLPPQQHHPTSLTWLQPDTPSCCSRGSLHSSCSNRGRCSRCNWRGSGHRTARRSPTTRTQLPHTPRLYCRCTLCRRHRFDTAPAALPAWRPPVPPWAASGGARVRDTPACVLCCGRCSLEDWGVCRSKRCVEAGFVWPYWYARVPLCFPVP